MSIELIGMMGATLPEEKIVDLLEEVISEWKVDPSRDNFEKISSVAVLVTFRTMSLNGGEGDEIKGFQSVVELINKVKDSRRLYNAMNGGVKEEKDG